MKSLVSPNKFNLNDIVLILSLSNSGSMSAAARGLGIDVSTVSRRVSAAEKALGTRLFTRTDTGYALTEAGKIFCDHAGHVHDRITSMMLACTDEAVGANGPVRVTSVEFLFDYWLVEHLPALTLAHPGLQVQLLSSDSNVSFTRREADFALRLSRPRQDAALVMRKFGELGFAVYGAREFASIPRSEWANCPWISYGDARSDTPEMQWLHQLGPRTRNHLQVSTLGTMVRACLMGNGLALLPCLLGAQLGLCKMSEKRETMREVWLLSHRDARSITRFKIFSQWLNDLYLASREPFSGTGPASTAGA